jgi:hypothetical protein
VKILIAVVTCHRFRGRADILRRTWVPDVGGKADVRFFLGNGGVHDGNPPSDEVWLDVGDDYKSLRLKTQAVFRWAVEQGYDFVFKTDDDVYVIPERLFKDFLEVDYAGRVRPASHENDAPRIYGPKESPFCSGYGYWLSQKAAQIVATSPENFDWAEDRYCGNMLFLAGIHPHHDVNFVLWPPLYGHSCTAPMGRCAPCLEVYKTASVICPYARPGVVETLHQSFKETGFIPTALR